MASSQLKLMKRYHWWWLSVILIIGLGLRLWQIPFGLPRALFVDEEFFTTPALQIADGGWNPGWYNAPASPQIYTIGVVWRVQNSLTNAFARQSLSPTQRYQADPTSLITSARVLSALMGTITIVLIFFLGAYASPSVGLVASGLVSGNFFLVDHGHVVRPDIWQTTFVVGAALWLWKFFANPSRRSNLWVFSVLMGLAITQKYTSVLLAPVALVVAILVIRKKYLGSWEMIMSAGLMLLTAVVAMPSLFFSTFEVVKDAAFEILQDHGVHSHLGIFGNARLYIESLSWQLGTVLSVVTLGGLVWSWRRKTLSPVTKYVLYVVVVYLVGLLLSKHGWDRWFIPIITLLAIPMAGVLIDIWSMKRFRPVALIVLCIAFFGPVLRLVRTEMSYTLPPTSEMTRSWLLDHAPNGATIVRDPYGPAVFPVRGLDTFTVIRTSSIGAKPLSEYPNGTYLLANDDIRLNLLTLAKRDGPQSSYAVVGGRYAEILRKFPLLYTTDPIRGLTPDELITANDFFIFRNRLLRVRRGPVMWVAQVVPVR